MDSQAMKDPGVREDEELQVSMRERMIGASQQATFHRIEAEKWERIAKATAAAVVALENAAAVAGLDPDDVYTDARKRSADETATHPDFSSAGQSRQSGAILQN